MRSSAPVIVSVSIAILLAALGWQFRRSAEVNARLQHQVEELERGIVKAVAAEAKLDQLEAEIDAQTTEILRFSSFFSESPIEQFSKALADLGYQIEGHRLIDEKKREFYDELVAEIDFSEDPGVVEMRGRMPIAAWLGSASGTTRRVQLYRAKPAPPYTPTPACEVDELPGFLVPFGKGPRELRERAVSRCAHFESKRFFADRVRVLEWNRVQLVQKSAIVGELAEKHGFDELAERLRSKPVELN